VEGATDPTAAEQATHFLRVGGLSFPTPFGLRIALSTNLSQVASLDRPDDLGNQNAKGSSLLRGRPALANHFTIEGQQKFGLQ
jgi:hypothetical protein